MPGEFESDERAHAMTEERERFVQMWREGLARGPHQLAQFGERRLRDARASSGQLTRADLNRLREALLPRAKDGISATSVRETEEAHSGPRIRLTADEPRRSRNHKGARSSRLSPVCSRTVSVMEVITKLGQNLARLDPVSPDQQRAVVEQVAAVRNVQRDDRHRPVFPELLPLSQIQPAVSGQVCRAFVVREP